MGSLCRRPCASECRPGSSRNRCPDGTDLGLASSGRVRGRLPKPDTDGCDACLAVPVGLLVLVRGDPRSPERRLATGKLFCLFGVLLTFSPRTIYGSLAPICFDPASPRPLVEDQQLAGLLMLAACPLVYVTAAIAIARRRLAALARDGGWSFGQRVG